MPITMTTYLHSMSISIIFVDMTVFWCYRHVISSKGSNLHTWICIKNKPSMILQPVKRITVYLEFPSRVVPESPQVVNEALIGT